MTHEILDGLQSLHFDTLTLSPIKANWVKRWSKVGTVSFIGPMMCVSSIKDGNTQLRVGVMVSKNGQ